MRDQREVKITHQKEDCKVLPKKKQAKPIEGKSNDNKPTVNLKMGFDSLVCEDESEDDKAREEVKSRMICFFEA